MVVTKYQKRISGPLLDRIYIHVEVPRVDYEKLSSDRLDKTGQTLMKTAMNQLQLLARAYHRVLKLGRTNADLAGSGDIVPAHLAEALQYPPQLNML